MTIGTSLALKRKCFLEIKGNHGIASKLQKEISERPYGDIVSGCVLFLRRELGVTGRDFAQRIRLKPVDQIVGLYAQTLASAHLDVRPRPILFAQLNP